MNKQLITFASILLAVLFIGVLSVLVFSLNTNITNTSNNMNSIMDKELYSLSDYVGKTITGQELINLLEYHSSKADNKQYGNRFTVEVHNGISKYSTYKTFGYVTGTFIKDIDNFIKKDAIYNVELLSTTLEKATYRLVFN